MIGRKIPCAGKEKTWEYGGFKKSIRIARKKRRAKRARKRRNGWMFGRKIRIRPQLYPVNIIPCITLEPEVITGRDQKGVEFTLYGVPGTWTRPPPKVKKTYDPSYDDVFKFFGDIADYNIEDVVFTVGNEPGSIPINEKVSFIPPCTNAAKVGKAKPAMVGKAKPAKVGESKPAKVGKAKPATVGKAKPATVGKAKPAKVGKAKPAKVIKG